MTHINDILLRRLKNDCVFLLNFAWFDLRAPHYPEVFLLLVVVATVSSPIFAQQNAVVLPEVVVTATRNQISFEDTLADVTVIGEERIEKSGAATLGELLRRQPGIEIARNGGTAAATSVFMRGSNSGHVVILIDGVRTAAVSTGATSLEMIPLAQISRIEIVRGAASSLYGADAVGGVIQIFTKRGDGVPLSLSGEVACGTERTCRGSGQVTGENGPLRWSFGLGSEHSNGFNAIINPDNYSYQPDRDGYQKNHQRAALELKLHDDHRLNTSFLRNDINAQIDSGSVDDERTRTLYTQGQLGGEHHITRFWTARWQYADMKNHSKTRGWGDTYRYKTQEKQYLFQNDIDIHQLNGTLLAAFEHCQERLISSTEFDRDQRNTNALIGGYRWQNEKHAMQLSTRYDHSSQYQGETTWGANYGYTFSPGWKVVVGAGSAFKAPSFNDLYFPGYANPDLVPEKAHNMELGVRQSLQRGDLAGEWRLTAWENRVKNLIAYTCNNEYICRPENVNRARLRGVTLSGDFDWRGYGVAFSFDWQSPKDRDTGLLLARRAKTHGSATLSRKLGAFYGAINVLGSGYRYDDAANANRLGSYGVVNLVAEWTMPISQQTSLTWFAHIDNLFDKNYALAADYETGGLQAMVGVRGRFN